MREIETPQGPARVHEQDAPGAWARMIVHHGAGGSVSAPDLQTAAEGGTERGSQRRPGRAALQGRRQAVDAPPGAAGRSRTTRSCADLPQDLPFLIAGRSSGARIACRTAAATPAIGVLALAFPLITPKGSSRQSELDMVDVPLLIVQGANDRFGVPDGAHVIKGDHGLKSDHGALADAITSWLNGVRG